MAKHIKNMDELAQAIQPVLLRMTDRLAQLTHQPARLFFISALSPFRYTENFPVISRTIHLVTPGSDIA